MESLYEKTDTAYWIEQWNEKDKNRKLYTIHAPFFAGMIKTYKSKSHAEKFCREANNQLNKIHNRLAESLMEFLNKRINP